MYKFNIEFLLSNCILLVNSENATKYDGGSTETYLPEYIQET